MEKKNVFMVSGRKTSEGAVGYVENRVVCAADSEAVLKLLEQVDPAFDVVTVTSLALFEDTIKKIKAVLSGQDADWPVYIDPELNTAITN